MQNDNFLPLFWVVLCIVWLKVYTAADESNNWAKQNEYEVIITSYWAKIDLDNRFFQIRNLCKICSGRLGILTDDYQITILALDMYLFSILFI